MNDDAVMTRFDIEMAHMINDGVYMVGINDIKYYSKYELNREQDGKSRNDSGNSEDVASSENQSTVEEEISTEENKNSSIDETLESEYIYETEKEINKTEETEETVEETEQTVKTESDDSEETASDNEDDIDDSTVEVQGSDYLVVADSAAEVYLALNFINSNNEIDITVMPELMNYGELGDIFDKFMRQNPYGNYICDFDVSDDGTKLLIDYTEDKEIDSQIIKAGMTDEEKVGAI